jgi:hypothetical protein
VIDTARVMQFVRDPEPTKRRLLRLCGAGLLATSVLTAASVVSASLYMERVCDFSAFFLLGRGGHSTGLDIPPNWP